MVEIEKKFKLEAINRYPIKGFSVDTLTQTLLETGKTIIGDRKYSFEDGDSGFDVNNPSHIKKSKFLVLMNKEKVASLDTEFNEDCTLIRFKKNNSLLISANINDDTERAKLDEFVNDYFSDVKTGSAKLLIAKDPDHSFSDVKDRCISLLNLESVKKFEADLGSTIDPIRFRCNLHFSGLNAFEELELIGKELQIGSARLKIFKKIKRCPAIDVNPQTAKRDTDLNPKLREFYNHMFMGIYAMVINDGVIKQNDDIQLLG